MKNLWYHETLGQGTHLVLLHGWGNDSRILRPLAQQLKATHQIHLFDLPGFGRTAPPSEVWSYRDYAKELEKQLDALGIDMAHLAGHSFGGKVALAMAAGAPHKVKKLTLIGAAGLKPKRSSSAELRHRLLKGAAALCRYGDELLGTHLFETAFVPRFASMDYIQAEGVMRSILVRTLYETVEAVCPEVETETLLLWGGRDEQTPVAMAHRFYQLLPRCDLCVLSQHGHHPFLGGGAHLCARYLRTFFLR